MTSRPNLPRLWRPLRRPAAAAAAALLACLALCLGPAQAANATESVFTATTTAPPATQSGASHPSGTRTATTVPSQFLSLSVDHVTPEAVTSGGPAIVTVAGTVSNVGDRTVSDIEARFQRGEPVTDSSGLRTSLSGDPSAYGLDGRFTTIAKELDPGQKSQFTLSIPLRSTDVPSLHISKPGVYPLLINVNGTPDYGGQARLADSRFLLPVLGVPALSGPGGSPAVPGKPDDPVGITMLYPLADAPKLAAGTPGDTTDPVRLVDDSLATSLAPGGRLDGLVSALTAALAPTADSDHRLASSVCLAIDPDLVITVNAMTQGYRVAQNPGDPAGPTHAGAGAQVARTWLAKLRDLSAHTCTTALPFGQVDLPALQQIGSPDLTARALSSPTAILDRILGITSVRGLTWPESGSLDAGTATMVTGSGHTTALVASDTVSEHADAGGTDSSSSGTVSPADDSDATPGSEALTGRLNGGLDLALFDTPTAVALAATGSAPQTPSYTPSSWRRDLDDSQPARLQDALGAMAWPAIVTNDTHPAPPRALIYAPPQVWSASETDAAATLGLLATMLHSGLSTPRPLAETLAAAASGAHPTAMSLDPPGKRHQRQVPQALVTQAAGQVPRIRSLQGTLVADPQGTVTPQSYMAPFDEDVLRAMSNAGRYGSDPAASDRAGAARIKALTAALDDQYGSITVLAPGAVYTLASSQSPLLLVVRNDLPIAAQVRLKIAAPDGVQIKDIGMQQLPPRGTRQIQVPAEVRFSRQMDLKVQLSTGDNVPLGDQIHIAVHSNAYGHAMTIVTASAGGLLLLLAGRRLWHRFRGRPDPADQGREA